MDQADIVGFGIYKKLQNLQKLQEGHTNFLHNCCEIYNFASLIWHIMIFIDKIMTQGKKMIQPPYLQAGDKVAIVSPAYWVPQEAMQMAADAIREWGLQPVIGPHANSLNVDAYAGTADERADDLVWALQDDSIKAVMCSRGGYGCIHLLNRSRVGTYRPATTIASVPPTIWQAITAS